MTTKQRQRSKPKESQYRRQSSTTLNSVKVIIKGSGSDGNTTVLKDTKSGDILILDCGIKPTKQAASRKGIVGVCITHCHRDHCGYAYRYNAPIVGTKEELEDERVLNQFHTPPNFLYIKPYECIHLGTFTIIALPANHDTNNPVHYLIQCRGFIMFYGCDTVGYPKSYDDYFDLCTYIMVDCNYDEDYMITDENTDTPYSATLKNRIMSKGHNSNQYISERFKKYSHKLILSHISRGYNSASKIQQVAAAYNTLKCPLELGETYGTRTGNISKSNSGRERRAVQKSNCRTVKKNGRI